MTSPSSSGPTRISERVGEAFLRQPAIARDIQLTRQQINERQASLSRLIVERERRKKSNHKAIKIFDEEQDALMKAGVTVQALQSVLRLKAKFSDDCGGITFSGQLALEIRPDDRHVIWPAFIGGPVDPTTGRRIRSRYVPQHPYSSAASNSTRFNSLCLGGTGDRWLEVARSGQLRAALDLVRGLLCTPPETGQHPYFYMGTFMSISQCNGCQCYWSVDQNGQSCPECGQRSFRGVFTELSPTQETQGSHPDPRAIFSPDNVDPTPRCSICRVRSEREHMANLVPVESAVVPRDANGDAAAQPPMDRWPLACVSCRQQYEACVQGCQWAHRRELFRTAPEGAEPNRDGQRFCVDCYNREFPSCERCHGTLARSSDIIWSDDYGYCSFECAGRHMARRHQDYQGQPDPPVGINPV